MVSFLKFLLLYFVISGAIQRGAYAIKFHNCHNKHIKDEITRQVFHLVRNEFGARLVGRVKVYPANSCDVVRLLYRDIGSGNYWIATEKENAVLMYCKV